VSPTHGSAAARAKDAIQQFDDRLHLSEPLSTEIAETVTKFIYLEITNAKQMIGVPEGAILIVPIGGGYVRPLVWSAGQFHGRMPGVMDPVSADHVIGRYGSLTVVWMP
jgi:hypothetical protein